MKRYFLLFITIALLTTCTDPEDEQYNLPSEVFEVTTLGLSLDCKLNVLQFNENDRVRLENLVGNQYVMDPNFREGINLDRNRFAEPSMKLRVRIRKILDSEAISCTTWGTRHPAVFVIDAEKVD